MQPGIRIYITILFCHKFNYLLILVIALALQCHSFVKLLRVSTDLFINILGEEGPAVYLRSPF